MRRSFEILSGKQIRDVLKLIEDQWGADMQRPGYGFIQKDTDIFLVSKDLDIIDMKKLQRQTNSMGLYFGEIRFDQIRLSIEGSQIIGPRACKNIVELNNDQIRAWLKGEDIENITDGADKYVLVKHSDDFYGCGRLKGNILLNFVPKSRRMVNV